MPRQGHSGRRALRIIPGRPSELRRPFLRSEGSAGETFDLDEAITVAHGNRNLCCPHYDNCLTHVAIKGWLGFTCRGCDEFYRHREGERAA